ncbi:MAG: hypothetical protein K0S47_3901 [Herbinix sp.]|nr:hypothetical protein [Herbinix sp.]
MKKVITKMLITGFAVLLFPFFCTLLFSSRNSGHTIADFDFKILYQSNGAEEELDFNKYLMGVVAANMPAGYEVEALKAQAVIARTYILYNLSLLSEEDNLKKSFTTSELGLSYVDLADMEQYWGSEDYLTYFSKIENAVYGTEDEVILYDDAFILPVFFDTGTGFTRNASEAWGVTIPYLISVASKQDVTSTNYIKITEYAVADLIATLTQSYPDIKLTEDTFFKDVTVMERDSTNYVTKMNLGGRTVSGEEFAKVLKLNSNHFYIEDYEGKARIICTGVGHGVGLSQFGSNAMAAEGSTYNEILTYYYPGTEVTKWK